MAEQEITKLKLSFETDIKDNDLNKTETLIATLARLDNVKIKDNLSGGINSIFQNLNKLNSLELNIKLNDGIDQLVSTITKISNIQDITPYAQRLESGFGILSNASKEFEKNKSKLNTNLGKGIGSLLDSISQIKEIPNIEPQANNIKVGFKILADASKSFEEFNAKIPTNLGRGINGLVHSIAQIKQVQSIEQEANNLKNGFRILASAVTEFDGVNAKISTTLGRGITGIVEAINSIENVKDITPYAENLNNGFSLLADITKHFEGNEARIPVGLGKAISGIATATEQVANIKDITQKAHVVDLNFATLARATRHFDNINNADYSGISRLISAVTSINRVKAIDTTVISNAKILAQAINVLDKEVKADIPKLQAMASVTKELGLGFKQADKGAKSFGSSLKSVNLAATIFSFQKIINTISQLTRQMYGTVDAFGEVQNTLSFFTQSLGDQASETAKVIQQYSDFGAVDFSKFSNQVAVLNQMYVNYGIGAENAAKMALNMTQLAYDASYALGQNGKDIDLWMQRVTAISTGQVRTGYWFGLDLSIKALSEDFDGLTSSVDKGTKFMAAYESIIQNTTAIQGQLAREFGNTYVQAQVLQNRIRQLKQSLGQALVPFYQSLIKWGLTAIRVTELIIDAVARLFGGSFKLINYEEMISNMVSSTGDLGKASGSVADGFKEANKAAKALNKTITGIDQVFTINDRKEKDPSPGGIGGVGGLGGSVPGYSWLDDLATAENLKALEDVEKNAQKVMKTLKATIPVAATLGSLILGMKFAKGFLTNLQAIENFKGLGGGVGLNWGLVMGGAALFLADINEFIDNLKLIANNPTFDNVSRTLTSFAGSLGDIFLMFGALQFAGPLKLFQGVTDIVHAIYNMTQVGVNWEDAERVLKGLTNVAIAVGALQGRLDILGGGIAAQGLLKIIGQVDEIVVAIKTGDWSGVDKFDLFIGSLMAVGGLITAYKKFEATTKASDTAKTLTEVPKTVGKVSEATGGVSTKLTSLAKNLGLGIVIMAEVAVIGGIFVGSIWALGKLLEQVGLAWDPVIKDGKNVATGIALGTALLAGVGLAMGVLGTLGTTLITPMAIGAGILAGLTLGLVAFVYELKLVADSITNKLSPSLSKLNEVMPDLTSNMGSFTKFMIEFAGHMVAYAGANTVSGIAGTIDTIVGWFTKDPITKMADDVKKNYKQFNDLNTQLTATNPLVKKASSLMVTYIKLLEQIYATSKTASELGTMGDVSVEFKKFSKDLKDGFGDLDKVKTSNIDKIMQSLSKLDLSKFKGMGTDIVKSMELGMTSYSFNLTSVINKIKNGLTTDVTSKGTDIARGLVNGINNHSVNVSTFNSKITRALTQNTTSIGSGISKNVISGVNTYSVSLSTFNNRVKNNLNFSSYYIGTNIARGVQNGINGFYPNLNTWTNRLKNGMKVSFEVRSPSRWAKREIGFNIAKGIVIGVNDTPVDFSLFKNTVSQGLDNMIPTIDIEPTLTMESLDTTRLRGSLNYVTKDLNANVESKVEYNADKTEKAVKELIAKTERTNMLLQTAIDKDLVVVMDEREVGRTAQKFQQNQESNNNRIL